MRKANFKQILQSELQSTRHSPLTQLKWAVAGIGVGVLAGLSSWVFLESLERVVAIFLENTWLIWGLPFAGVILGLVITKSGQEVEAGTALLLDEVHQPTSWVPRRLGPIVLGGTLWTHLFGGSVGREGTALQLSGWLTDLVARTLGLRADSRGRLLVAALAGGFGATFGVPLAGAVFALEVPSIGRLRSDRLVPALAASITGNEVIRLLGHHERQWPVLLGSNSLDLLRAIVAGVLFGLVALVFVELTNLVHRISHKAKHRSIPMFCGGLSLSVLSLVIGTEAMGLSEKLFNDPIDGIHVNAWSFVFKLVLTAITIGTGFIGGEVTPLFIIGASMGQVVAPLLGLNLQTGAAIGAISVFAAASNTPIACTIMGLEIFGRGVAAPMAISCAVATVVSGIRSIYGTQRIELKAPTDNTPTSHPRLDEWRYRSHKGES